MEGRVYKDINPIQSHPFLQFVAKTQGADSALGVAVSCHAKTTRNPGIPGCHLRLLALWEGIPFRTLEMCGIDGGFYSIVGFTEVFSDDKKNG